MNRRKADMRLLRISLGAFGLMSASFLLMMPQFKTEEAWQLTSILAGVCFWLSLLVGIALQLRLWTRCRKHYKTHRQAGKPVKWIGAVCFFRNPAAAAADIALAVSLAALGLSLWLTNGSGAICFLFFSATMFAFCAHCVYNGRSYYFITRGEAHMKLSRGKVRPQPEQSKEDAAEKGEE